MKPFFSIRIDYNPADGEDMVAFDENAIRLALARETERGEGERRNYETWQNVAVKITSAIQWFRDNADPADEELLSALFFEMRLQFQKQFIEAIEEAASCGDEEDVEALRAAIDRGVKASTEPLEDDK